jgi:non-heme chloroperoxidase
MSREALRLCALGREAHYRGSRVRTPDGLSISVQDWRRPTSSGDVLLMHGYCQSHLCWLKQVSGPLASEFRLVTYDIRGHGDSDKPSEAQYYREPERWAGEVAAVIRELGLHRPALVFWSYAGRIALDYISSRGDSDISALVFVNATSKMDATVSGPAAPLMQRMAQGELATDIEATTAFLRACSAKPLPEEELRYLLAHNMLVPPQVRANLTGREANYESTLRGLKVPVLALHGSEDSISLPAMAQYTCAMAPNARSIIYPGVGHMPFWEAPELFDHDLGAFLRTLE